jgi:hypothetical protein
VSEIFPAEEIWGFFFLREDFSILNTQIMGEPHRLASPGLSDLSMDLSAYAELFGESQDPLFKGKGKSGLTPTDPLDPTVSLSPKSAQRKKLQGFITRELQDAGCLEDSGVAPCDLTVPVLPLLQRKNWLESSIPIGDGYVGNWAGAHDDVWRILKPCLRIATLLISKSALWVC